jgi:DNA-directed RNA polymerase specialized sigma24 family protein
LRTPSGEVTLVSLAAAGSDHRSGGGNTETTAWLPEAVELDAYEGIRNGDERAFRVLAEPLQLTLRRLAGLYVDSAARADAVVLHSWEVALRGPDMFRWHTPYATWVAGIVVAFGRRSARAAGPAGRARWPTATAPRCGPEDWSDLPWSARWEGAGATLARTLATLPASELEVIHGRDIEGWPHRRVCDVFGLLEVTYEQQLTSGHERLREALAHLIAQPPGGEHHAAQLAATARCLTQRSTTRPEPLDPRAVEVFRSWSASRTAGWRRLTRGRPDGRGASPQLSGPGGPAARRGGRGSGSASVRPRPT